jgi:transcriptional regulator with XRE-family HTH domain
MNHTANGWRSLLREARGAVSMTRDELAERSGVAAVTIKAYELGQRNPSRPLLTALLTALGVDRFLRNQVLEGAGFRPDGLDVWARNPDFALSLEEALAEAESCRWPAFVSGEGLKLIATNGAYGRLWGRPSSPQGAAAAGDSFLSWLSYPAVADRLKNWDEVMAFLIGELKGSLRFPEEVPEGTSPHIKAALERFFLGDATYIARYLALWERVPAARAKARFSYRVVMDHPRLGVLTFGCLGMGVNEVDGLILNDWVPEDADTWSRLEQGGVVARPL